MEFRHDHNLVLQADGRMVAWGYNYQGQANVPGGLTNVVAVAAGGCHSLALIGNGPPFLPPQMTNRFVLCGSTVYLSAYASGTRPLSYQWQCNGTNLPGATNAWMTLAGVRPAQAGSYSLVVTNAFGSVTGSVAALTVLVPLQIQADAGFGVPSNAFGFRIAGNAGEVVVLEACTNLANPVWIPIQTNTLGADPLPFSEPGWRDYTGRFYRLRK